MPGQEKETVSRVIHTRIRVFDSFFILLKHTMVLETNVLTQGSNIIISNIKNIENERNGVRVFLSLVRNKNDKLGKKQ